MRRADRYHTRVANMMYPSSCFPTGVKMICSCIHTLICVCIYMPVEPIFCLFAFLSFLIWLLHRNIVTYFTYFNYFCRSPNSPPPALPPKKRQSAPSPTRVAVVAPMSRGSSLPCSVHRQVSNWVRLQITFPVHTDPNIHHELVRSVSAAGLRAGVPAETLLRGESVLRGWFSTLVSMQQYGET